MTLSHRLRVLLALVLALVVAVLLPLHGFTFELVAPAGVSPPQLLAEVTPAVVMAPPDSFQLLYLTDHSSTAGHGDGGERTLSAATGQAPLKI